MRSFYPELNKFWERERKSKELIGLKNDFFERARAYLNHLESLAHTEQDPLLKELFNKRWKRVTYLVNDFINLRIEKHIRQTLDGEFHEYSEMEMPHEERKFRERLEKLTSNFREAVHGIGTEEGNEDLSTVLDDEGGKQLVNMIKSENQPMLGSDLKNYGPFKQHDLVFLPVENARIMIKKSQAERIILD